MQWFEKWFGSYYYKQLYKHRDEEEAMLFISKLVKQLPIQAGSHVLDVACGFGRHSHTLYQLGFVVDGFDINIKAIQGAQQQYPKSAQFYCHDMRKVFRINQYDLVLNIFTSFGYFDKDADNVKAAKAMALAVKPNGLLVMDYVNKIPVVNSPTIDKCLEHEEEGTIFQTRKSLQGDFVVKTINVINNEQGFEEQYMERVRLFDHMEMINLFEQHGLKATKLFGDYELNPYDVQTSPRMVIVFNK